MISAERAFDRNAIRAFIEDHALDPIPSADPRSIARDGVSLTVETYGWGRVFYAEWKARDVGVTWVEREEGRPPLPAWAEGIRGLLERPGCLGHHADDHVCDGGKNPDTGEREPPCRWRTACLYVQTLAKTPAGVPAVLQTSDEELWERAIVMFPEKEKGNQPRPEQLRARRAGLAANLENSRELVDLIARRVCEIGSWTFQERRFRATIGEFYLVEHSRERSDRNPVIVLFRRRPRSWTNELVRDSTTEQSICRFLPHSSAPTCSVQIRTDAIEIVRDACPSLACNRAAAGASHQPERRLVTVRNVTGDHVDEVANAIVRVVNGNLLTSWGMGALDPDRPGFDPTTVKSRRRRY